MLVPSHRYASSAARNGPGQPRLADPARGTSLRVGVGEHARRPHLSPSPSSTPGGAAVLTRTRSTAAAGADLRARLARRVGHLLGHAPDAAAHEPPLAHAAARPARTRGRAAARTPSPGSTGRDRVVDRVPAQRRLDVFGLEALVEELAGGGGEQEQRVDDRPRWRAPVPPSFNSPPRSRGRRIARVRRRPVDHRRDHLGEPAEIGLERRAGPRIAAENCAISRASRRGPRRSGAARRPGTGTGTVRPDRPTTPRSTSRMSRQTGSRSI